MSRYLDEVTTNSTNTSSDSLSSSSYERKRRFLYSLGSDGIPQLVLSQQLEESHDGGSAVWQNDQLIFNSIQPDEIGHIRISLSSDTPTFPYGASFEKKVFNSNGLEASYGGYYRYDDNKVSRNSSSLTLDRKASTFSFRAFNSEATPQNESFTYYFKPGATQLRASSLTGPIALDFSVSGNQSSGFTLKSNSYAPYFNSKFDSSSQSSFTPISGTLNEIANRNIALDLLGWSGDGFTEAIINAALNILNPTTFKTGLEGLMPTSQSNSSSESNSSRTWTYDNGYAIASSDIYSGHYMDEGKHYTYSGTESSSGIYTATPRLISQSLSASELADLRTAVSTANATYLSPYGLPSIDPALIPSSGGAGNSVPTFRMVLVPGLGIKDLLTSVPAAVGLSAGQPKDIAPTNGATINVSAPGWSDTIQLIRISKADTAGSRLQTRQPDSGFGTKVGSLIVGGDGNDVITGGFGWDIADGGAGNDLVKVGNGRDILTGGLGADELWGGFGWNTFRSEQDGSPDLLVIRSDQWLINPRQNNTAFNNADGSKADVIEGLDSVDRITIQGVATADISVSAGVTTPAVVTGIGVYAGGALEALYTGSNLSTTQLLAMVSGDNSQAAIDNTIVAYGSGWG